MAYFVAYPHMAHREGELSVVSSYKYISPIRPEPNLI
jgi:hypothetical protein